MQLKFRPNVNILIVKLFGVRSREYLEPCAADAGPGQYNYQNLFKNLAAAQSRSKRIRSGLRDLRGEISSIRLELSNTTDNDAVKGYALYLRKMLNF
jgi:hypothetical protein